MVTTSDRMAGAEKSIYDLLRLIDQNTYEPRLVIFKHEKNGELTDKVRALGIRTESIGIQLKWQFFKLVKLWKVIREFRPDILESFLYFDNQVCRLMGRLAKVPVVISGLQNIETKQSTFRKFVDQLTARYVDAVVSNSDAGKDLYVSRNYLPPEKVFIAKSGIDLEQLKELQSHHVRNDLHRLVFEIEIPKDHQVLFTVGFLTEQKGTIYLIRALKCLKDHGRKIICFIAGQGHLQEMFDREVRELGISDTVHFLGYVKSSYQYLPLFDMFVLPSLWEGLPNVIIEAMASRVLVVATNVGGVSELITDGVTGFLSKPADAQEFAWKIEQALDLPTNVRARILESAYQHIIKSFTTESMVAAYISCYEHLLQAKR